MNNFLTSFQPLFNNYKMLAEKAIAQLNEEDLHKVPAAESNSIAVIMKHMAGNMYSRFTDFLTTDGEKPWRNRDTEFEPVTQSKAELLAYWDQGWEVFFKTLAGLKPEHLDQIVYIRNEGHTVLEALNRQLAHYAYHVGQIVYVAKLWKGAGFQSLSIPKGASATFNTEKFGE